MLKIQRVDAPETVTFSITLPKGTRDQLSVYGKLTNRSQSELITIMVDRFLEADKDFQQHLAEQRGQQGSVAEMSTKRPKAKAKVEGV